MGRTMKIANYLWIFENYWRSVNGNKRRVSVQSTEGKSNWRF